MTSIDVNETRLDSITFSDAIDSPLLPLLLTHHHYHHHRQHRIMGFMKVHNYMCDTFTVHTHVALLSIIKFNAMKLGAILMVWIVEGLQWNT